MEKHRRDMVFGDWKKYLSGAKKDLSADDRRILPYSDVERLFRENRQAEGAGFLREKSAGASFDPEIDFRKLAVPAVGWELPGCCQYFNVWPGPDRSSAGQVAGRAQGLYV